MRLKPFNPNKELKKVNRKYTKKQLITTLLVLVVMITIGTSYAIFSIQPEYHTFVKSQVGEFSTGDIKLSVLVEGVTQSDFPAKDTGYAFEKVECENGSTGTWDADAWQLTLTAQGPDKCSAYFDKSSPYIEAILNKGNDLLLEAIDIEGEAIDIDGLYVNLIDDDRFYEYYNNFFANEFEELLKAYNINDYFWQRGIDIMDQEHNLVSVTDFLGNESVIVEGYMLMEISNYYEAMGSLTLSLSTHTSYANYIEALIILLNHDSDYKLTDAIAISAAIDGNGNLIFEILPEFASEIQNGNFQSFIIVTPNPNNIN